MPDLFGPATRDRAVRSFDEDLLDRDSFVDSIVKALICEMGEDDPSVQRRSTGYVVGLTGRWGLGKSTILNLVEARLNEYPLVAVAKFNPWLFKGRDELLAEFFNALRNALGRSAGEAADDLVKKLDEYRDSIDVLGNIGAKLVDAHFGGGWCQAAWKSAKKFLFGGSQSSPGGSKGRSPEQERQSLEDKLRASNVGVVVLIDEVDRLEDEETRVIAQLIKAIGEIEGISYLVAYDPERVAIALGRGDGDERRISGERYLEKIIQHALPLRPLFVEDVERLLDDALQRFGVCLPLANERQRSIHAYLTESIETPREIKRLIGTFSILESAVRGEIDPYDVLAYSWILTKSPILRETVATSTNKLVVDPEDEVEVMNRMIRDSNGKRTITTPSEVLGSGAKPFEKLLRILFPRFADEDRGQFLSYSTPRPRDTIAHRRNLIRLLYLGNPPGMVSRVTVDEVWNSLSVEEVETKLHQLRAQKKLRPFLDRLADLLPSMSNEKDAIFWPALSRVLMRQTDWAHDFDEAREAADDGSACIMQLALPNGESSPRALSILTALIEDGDLLLVPSILRKHAFGYGLNGRQARLGPTILTEQQTRELIQSEIPRYRTAVVDETVLRRVPDTEIIFLLLNMSEWHDLREIVTTQLNSMESIATFASLIVPPGYRIESSTLDELINVDVVFAAIDESVGSGWHASSEWLGQCVDNLRDSVPLHRRQSEVDVN